MQENRRFALTVQLYITGLFLATALRPERDRFATASRPERDCFATDRRTLPCEWGVAVRVTGRDAGAMSDETPADLRRSLKAAALEGYSPLFRYLWENRHSLGRTLAVAKRPGWANLALTLEAAGIHGSNGVPATPNAVRLTWKRVCQEADAKRQRRKNLNAKPIPSPRLAVATQLPVAQTRHVPPITQLPRAPRVERAPLAAVGHPPLTEEQEERLRVMQAEIDEQFAVASMDHAAREAYRNKRKTEA